MAYNTKIDLYDGKVEQQGGEELHLSGCTYVFGQFVIQSGATISILDNAGNGKVLTSNADGLGTWQIPSSGGEITGGTNGLCLIGHNIVLGGNLTGNTCININNFDFKLYDSTPTAFIEICDSTCTTTLGSTAISAINIFQGTCTCLTQSLSGAIFTDNSTPTPTGLQYANDYSANYTSRSLVDKGYVDSHSGSTISLSIFTITGNSSATGFTINHNKGKQFVAVEVVKNNSPYDTIYTSISRPDTNNVCIRFDTAPASGQQYKILITG